MATARPVVNRLERDVPRGRLLELMREVLDEAAVICKIADLPAVYSPRAKGHRGGVILGPYHQKRGAGSTWTLCGAPSTLLTGPLVPSMDGNPWALAAGRGSREIQDVRGTRVFAVPGRQVAS